MKEQRGGVRERVCQDRGGGGKEREGKRGRRDNWECAAATRRGEKKLLLCCTFPSRIPVLSRPIFSSLSVVPPPPPLRLYKHQHTWSEFVDEGLASVSVSSEQRLNL